LPATTWTLPCTIGLAAAMPLTLVVIASASSSVSVLPVPAPPAIPPARAAPGEIVSTFVPNPDNEAVTVVCEPCPSPTMAMTAATPIMIPSAVRAARALFARSASSAEATL
jgi:hypothetical protein